MRFLKIAFAILLSAFIISCNNQPSTSAEEKKPEVAPVKAAPSTSLNERGTNNLLSLLSSYYELKDALIATDAQKADIGASHVLTAAETMKHELGDTHPPIRTALDTLMQQSEEIVNVKDETCEKKRAIFEQISDNIFNIARQSGLKHGSVYRQFCPMAFNDKGAYWISNEEEIRNPYLPKTMLHCGEVQDSL
jgi:hypothetical protein